MGRTDMQPGRSPLDFYAPLKALNWSSRLFLTLRWKMTPFSAMAREISNDATILDFGCGHGLFALFLATQSPNRKTFGIDHDSARIQIARAAAAEFPLVRFERESLSEIAEGHASDQSNWLRNVPFDVISLIDVLHYFPHAQQEALLKRCLNWLKVDGILLIREVDPRSGPASHITQLYEKFSTTIGITRSNQKSELFIRETLDWTQLLDRCGYEVKQEPCTHPLFSDVLFTARKKRIAEK